MADCRALSRGRCRCAAAALSAGLRAVGPNYERPQMPTPAQYRFVEGPAAGAVARRLSRGGRCSTIRRCRRSSARRLPTTSTCRRRSRGSRRRARAPASRSRSSTRRSTAASATACARRRTRRSDGDDRRARRIRTAIYGFQLSWEIDLFGRLRREHEAALALLLASEQAPPRRAGHAGRRRRVELLPAARARSAARHRAPDAAPQRRDGRRYFRNRLDGGVSNRLELDRIQAMRAQTAAAIPDIEQQIAIVENALSLLLGRPPGPITRERLADAEPCRRRFRPACRPRCSSGGPTSCRRSSCSSRPTPTSAPPRRCSFRRSA